MQSRSKARFFWPVIAVVIALDVLTKAMAVQKLIIPRVPHSLFGDVVQLTLVYNPGAAFGMHLGSYSRVIFTVLTIVALVILGRLYRATIAGDVPRVLALGLVCGGAVGNLIDRLRSPMGVVDFLDVGVGTVRWPTFNVADMAVSCGAVLLAWVLWREDQAAARVAAAKPSDASHTVPSLAALPSADAGDLA